MKKSGRVRKISDADWATLPVGHPFTIFVASQLFIKMTLRSAQETLESLRVTLQKLEHTADPDQHADSMATFESILLNRIADLEMTATLAPAETEIAESPAPADLVPPSSLADGDFQKEASGRIQLEALD